MLEPSQFWQTTTPEADGSKMKLFFGAAERALRYSLQRSTADPLRLS